MLDLEGKRPTAPLVFFFLKNPIVLILDSTKKIKSSPLIYMHTWNLTYPFAFYIIIILWLFFDIN